LAYRCGRSRIGETGGNPFPEQVPAGDGWADVPGQERTPPAPLPNYNRVRFPSVAARRVRVLMTPTPGFGIGLKEIQVFHTAERDD
jgi:hypothetical protein